MKTTSRKRRARTTESETIPAPSIATETVADVFAAQPCRGCGGWGLYPVCHTCGVTVSRTRGEL